MRYAYISPSSKEYKSVVKAIADGILNSFEVKYTGEGERWNEEDSKNSSLLFLISHEKPKKANDGNLKIHLARGQYLQLVDAINRGISKIVYHKGSFYSVTKWEVNNPNDYSEGHSTVSLNSLTVEYAMSILNTHVDTKNPMKGGNKASKRVTNPISTLSDVPEIDPIILKLR